MVSALEIGGKRGRASHGQARREKRMPGEEEGEHRRRRAWIPLPFWSHLLASHPRVSWAQLSRMSS